MNRNKSKSSIGSIPKSRARRRTGQVNEPSRVDRGKHRNYMTIVPHYSGPVPRSQFVRMCLSFTQTVTVAAGVAQADQYLCNSISDPTGSIGARRPYPYGLFALTYNRYRVHSSYAEVTSAGTNDVYRIVGLYTNGAVVVSPTTTATTDAILELPYVRAHYHGFAGSPSHTIKTKSFLPELNGLTLGEYDSDDRTASQFGSNPTENIYFYVVVNNLSTSTETVVYNIRLFFDVELLDPIQQAVSFSSVNHDQPKTRLDPPTSMLVKVALN